MTAGVAGGRVKQTTVLRREKMEMDKFLYSKAIEGYQQHHHNFNHWMNMFALFNGALFAGYCTLKAGNCYISIILEFMILLLGLFSGWLWFFSVCGFYRWILSWIGVVTYYEQELNKAIPSKEDTLKTQDQEMYLYRMFVHQENECCFFRNKPISTQKLTKLFVLVVAVIWSILLGNLSYNQFFSKSNADYCKIDFWIIYSLLIIVFLFTISLFRRENLSDTHKHFKRVGIYVRPCKSDYDEEV